MKVRPLLSGIATFIPFAHKLRIKGTGGTDSARYCYSVWLRHLIMAERNGLGTNPSVIAELGPGDSLGIGLAALISGCNRYFAFDVVDYSDSKINVDVFDELVTLFRERTPIPDDREFPNLKPYVDTYDFPAAILSRERLDFALQEERLSSIRNSLKGKRSETNCIQFIVPWHDSTLLEAESVDMIYSQAVLEHVDDLSGAYEAMYSWLKPSGFISHQIDYKCHGTADEWNGHWSHSDFMWKLIRGRRPYLLNREPHSSHRQILSAVGFKLLSDIPFQSTSNLSDGSLAPRFRHLSHEDLTTSGAFVQAVKNTTH